MAKVKKSRFGGRDYEPPPLEEEPAAMDDADSRLTTESEDSDREYEVLEIMEHRINAQDPTKKDYLIRWRAYDDPMYDSWEPEDHLQCDLKIQLYWSKKGKGERLSRASEDKEGKGEKLSRASKDKEGSKTRKSNKSRNLATRTRLSDDSSASESDKEVEEQSGESYKKKKDLGSRPQPGKDRLVSNIEKFKEVVEGKKRKKIKTESLEKDNPAWNIPLAPRANPIREEFCRKRAGAPAAECGVKTAKPPKREAVEVAGGFGKNEDLRISSKPRKRALLDAISSEEEGDSRPKGDSHKTRDRCDNAPLLPASSREINRDLFGSSLSSLSPSPSFRSPTRSSSFERRKRGRKPETPTSPPPPLSPSDSVLLFGKRSRKSRVCYSPSTSSYSPVNGSRISHTPSSPNTSFSSDGGKKRRGTQAVEKNVDIPDNPKGEEMSRVAYSGKWVTFKISDDWNEASEWAVYYDILGPKDTAPTETRTQKPTKRKKKTIAPSSPGSSGVTLTCEALETTVFEKVADEKLVSVSVVGAAPIQPEVHPVVTEMTPEIPPVTGDLGRQLEGQFVDKPLRKKKKKKVVPLIEESMAICDSVAVGSPLDEPVTDVATVHLPVDTSPGDVEMVTAELTPEVSSAKEDSKNQFHGHTTDDIPTEEQSTTPPVYETADADIMTMIGNAAEEITKSPTASCEEVVAVASAAHNQLDKGMNDGDVEMVVIRMTPEAPSVNGDSQHQTVDECLPEEETNESAFRKEQDAVALETVDETNSEAFPRAQPVSVICTASTQVDVRTTDAEMELIGTVPEVPSVYGNANCEIVYESIPKEDTNVPAFRKDGKDGDATRLDVCMTNAEMEVIRTEPEVPSVNSNGEHRAVDENIPKEDTNVPAFRKDGGDGDVTALETNRETIIETFPRDEQVTVDIAAPTQLDADAEMGMVVTIPENSLIRDASDEQRVLLRETISEEDSQNIQVSNHQLKTSLESQESSAPASFQTGGVSSAYRAVEILPAAYQLLESTPLADLVVEEIMLGDDRVNNVAGYGVQFKGFPSMLFLREDTMRKYFMDDLLHFYEKVLVFPSVMELGNQLP
ncbi:uncharacterized protein LOC129584599 [Paramacrobiotus metropolitanus]|uniref:uncharacterized protein LOC129584599 n=1 Tax=Paramacrobiotus metropolitanus TaxID=2943436 RepID=UPI002445DF7B|nr:uncharacterized protein LOC129584599 [Paramacrobiotus metropolitanus]XP_055332804.1 uncharacterized protein LOC129584599 [Paramacrobiotus metropolitanus]